LKRMIGDPLQIIFASPFHDNKHSFSPLHGLN
jgi:hypothetical protein